MPAMQPSFAVVRERYLEELIEHEWYDVRTFGKKQPQEMTTPEYLVELLQHGHVTAVEMHSHTPRSDGLIEDVSEVLVCYSLGVYETQSNPQANRVIA
jgi:predicted site-specific integrase-resolvase